jgi:hypothetical protein
VAGRGRFGWFCLRSQKDSALAPLAEPSTANAYAFALSQTGLVRSSPRGCYVFAGGFTDAFNSATASSIRFDTTA